MFTQETLHHELARRVLRAETWPDAPAAPLPPTPPPLAELAAAEQHAPDAAAIAVIRAFEPLAFVRSVLEFALGLEESTRATWLRAFTRTVFLAGNPANLAERFPFDHVTPDASIAWLGPASPARTTGLRRLLKRFDGDVEPELPPTAVVDVPGAGGVAAHCCEIATSGVTISDYLIHVNHLLAESVLTHVIRPGDKLVLRHVPRLGVDNRRHTALRVHRDSADPNRLRAYACLFPMHPTPDTDPTEAGA